MRRTAPARGIPLADGWIGFPGFGPDRDAGPENEGGELAFSVPGTPAPGC